MRWGLVVAAVLVAGCGSGKKPVPPPAQPVLAFVHQDPQTYVGGAPLDAADIGLRELRCERPGNYVVTLPLPDDGRLPIARFLADTGLQGELSCVSVVYVAGVASRESNRVRFHCDPPIAPGLQRCWQR